MWAHGLGCVWPGLGHWAAAALNPVVVLNQPIFPASFPASVYLLIATLHWVPWPLCQLTFGQGHCWEHGVCGVADEIQSAECVRQMSHHWAGFLPPWKL